MLILIVKTGDDTYEVRNESDHLMKRFSGPGSKWQANYYAMRHSDGIILEES